MAFFPVIDAIQEFKIESNSPPAEFGRFNGGVVNLTTKAGANAFHGDGFEFLRNEALNARNFFQSTNPVKPDYRRNQFGGTLGGPLVQGPHVLLRRLPGTAPVDRAHGRPRPCRRCCSGRASSPKPIGGRVPVIYDPATTVGSTRVRRFPATRFRSAGWIPSRWRCCSAIRCRPSPGTANNYSRTANEIDNQDQWDVRIDHRFASNRDQVFGRLSYFRDGFVPVTPLPDGSGVTTGTLGPAGHDRVVVRVELPAHVLGERC